MRHITLFVMGWGLTAAAQPDFALVPLDKLVKDAAVVVEGKVTKIDAGLFNSTVEIRDVAGDKGYHAASTLAALVWLEIRSYIFGEPWLRALHVKFTIAQFFGGLALIFRGDAILPCCST